MLIFAQIHISDLHQWKLTADQYLENKALGRNWKYGNKRWKTHKVGNTSSDLVIDKDSGDALGWEISGFCFLSFCQNERI